MSWSPIQDEIMNLQIQLEGKLLERAMEMGDRKQAEIHKLQMYSLIEERNKLAQEAAA